MAASAIRLSFPVKAALLVSGVLAVALTLAATLNHAVTRRELERASYDHGRNVAAILARAGRDASDRLASLRAGRAESGAIVRIAYFTLLGAADEPGLAVAGSL